MNNVLKKVRSLPIFSMVNAMYERCNKYFVTRGKQTMTLMAVGKDLTNIAAKFIPDEADKLHFSQQKNPFILQSGVFQKIQCRTCKQCCDCGKFQNLYMPHSHAIAACKYVHVSYGQFCYFIFIYVKCIIGFAYCSRWRTPGGERIESSSSKPTSSSFPTLPNHELEMSHASYLYLCTVLFDIVVHVSRSH